MQMLDAKGTESQHNTSPSNQPQQQPQQQYQAPYVPPVETIPQDNVSDTHPNQGSLPVYDPDEDEIPF